MFLYCTLFVICFSVKGEKFCKIKRSVSNFDDSLYCKTRLDNPWKLQRPSEQSKNDLIAQYLSFEFLNERITNRLQKELSNQNGNNCLAYFSWETDSKPAKSEHFGKLSSSETNLSHQPNGRTVNKQKSFKKLLEHYFVSESTSGTLNSVSSHDSLFTLGDSVMGYLDQNFILKRSTPNAGLTDNDRFQQSNLKGMAKVDFELSIKKNLFNIALYVTSK